MKRFRNIQFKLLAVLAFLAISITSCVDAPEPSISVDKTTLTTEAYGDNFLYKITSNAEWTLKSDSDWCVPSQTEGLGTETINIKVSVNSSTSSREATLTLTCGGNSTTIKVLQGAQSTVLQASPESTTVSANDQTLNVVVVSNDSWTTESSHDWATITKGVETGSNNGVVSIAVDENTTGSERTATLTAYVTRDNEQSLVSTTTITQNAKSAPTVDLSQSSISFSSAAGSLLVPFVSNTTDITLISDFSWCVPTLDGDNVKISVGANTTSTSSRVAIVTVSALVDGKATSTQILVTQEGSPSSELYIITTNHNIAQAGGNSTLQYSNTNGSDVTIKSLTSWVLVSTSGNTFSVLENLSTDSRVGTIEIASENSTGKSLYYVTVTQAGTGTPTAFTSPSSVSLAPESGKGTVNVFVDSSVVTWEKATSSSSWLTINSIKDGEVSYSYTQSTSDAIREATISVIYKVGSTPYSITVPVVQNGLGAPTLSTLEQIFVQCDETSRTVDLWMLDGDTDNVTYQVFTESYGSGVSNDSSSSDSEWIRQAYVKDHQLIIDFYTNLNDSERYGTITIIATRGDSQTITKIEVVQGGHLSAGISAGSQEIFHDYQAADTCSFAYTSLNNSTVTIVSSPDWITNTAIKSTNDGFTYSILEYTGGITGTFREGYIVLRADNGSSNSILYSILVRQYAPEDAEADLDSSVYVEYGKNEYYFILDLQNDATIKSATSSDEDWLTIGTIPTGTGTVYLPYTVQQFTGATGTSREAKVTITVENASANTSTYTITVTQGEPVAAGADVPGTVYVPYGVTGSTGNAVKSTHNFSIELTAGSSIYSVAVLDPTVSDWLAVTTSTTYPSASSASTKAYVYFNTTTNLGDEGERTGTLAITVQSANANKEVYYVDIVQGTPEDPIIEISSAETYPYTATEENYTVPFNVPSTVTAVYAQLVDTTNDWVTVYKENENILGNGALSFGLDINDTGLSRTAVVMLTAEGDSYRDAVTYFTITQEELGAVSTSYPSTIYVPNTGTTVTEDGETSTSFVTVNLSSYLYNNGKISGVEVSQGNGTETWLYVGANTDYTFTYKVDLFAGPEESRTGTITLTLKNDNSQVETHTIYVIQGAVVDAAADVPASYTFGYEGIESKDLTADINLKNGSSIASIKVVDLDGADTSWLTVSSDNELTVDEHNGLNGSRSGKLLVTISNESYNDEFYYIDIYQGVPDEPTIEVPEYTLAYDYTAHTGLSFNVNPNGSTTVTASSDNTDWLKVTQTVSDGIVKYSINEYDNSSEDFREGTITLVASNDNYRDDIAYVSVRQYAQGAAGIEGLAEISVSSQEKEYSTWVNLLNESTIKEIYSSDEEWLTMTDSSEGATGTVKLSYSVEAYDGTAGDYRQGVIYIVVSNNNSDVAIYTLTVTQGAPSSDLAEVSGSVNVPTTGTNSVDSDAAEYSFNTTLASGAVVTKIEVLDSSETDWITLGAADLETAPTAYILEGSYDQDGIDGQSYYVAAYDGSKGDSREGIIAMTVLGPDGNVVIYNIVVTQGAAVEQILTVGTESTFGFNAGSGTINFTVSGEDTSVTAKKQNDNTTWLNTLAVINNNQVTFNLADNDTGESRSVMIELKATGSYFRPATAYVLVTQTAEGAAMMDEIATQYVDYVYGLYTIKVNLKNDAKITGVVSNNTDMLHVKTSSTTESGEVDFTYEVTAFDDPTNAGSRTGTMSITVANDNAETATYSLTVVQGAPAEASADVPSSLTVPHVGDTENYTFFVYLAEGSSISSYSVEDSSATPWLNVGDMKQQSNPNTYLMNYTVDSSTGSTSETNTGLLKVVVKSASASVAAYYVTVNRGTPADPVINIEQSFSYDYNATADDEVKTITYTTTDATSVTATVDTTVDWITNLACADGQITFGLTENTTGAPRSATMTVTATGDSYRDAITYVTITQNELGAASVNAYSTIYAPYSGTIKYTDDEGDHVGLVKYNLSSYLENGAMITAVTFDGGSDSTGWLEAYLYSPYGDDKDSTVPRDLFVYQVLAYDGAENTSRTGTITLTLKNSNDEEEFFTFTVIQGASTVIPDEVSASTVESMSIPYAAGSYTVPVVPTLGEITGVAVVSEEADWLTIDAATDKKSATVTTADNYTESTPRSAIVSVTVENGDASATYLVTVYQGVSEDASLTVPSEVLVYDYNYQEVLLDLDYTGTVTAAADAAADWYGVRNGGSLNSDGKLNYYLKYFTGTSSSTGYRQGMITVTAENNGRTAVGYIVVRQYEQDKAVVEGVTNINIVSSEINFISKINLLSDAWIQNVRTSDSWLLFPDGVASYSKLTGSVDLSLAATANTSTSSREAYVYVTAINNNQETCLYTITVTQEGADPIEDATISTVPDVELLYGATDEGETNDVIVSVGDGVDNVNASHTADWITLTAPVTKAAGTSVDSDNYDYGVSTSNQATVAFTVTKNSTGATRTAYITLTASGDEVNTTVTYLKVSQNAEGDVSLTYDTILYVPYSGVAFGSIGLADYIENDGVITKVSYEQGNGDGDWLTTSTNSTTGFNGNAVLYKVTEFEAIEGSSRTGYIVVTIANDTNSKTFRIQVVQGASTAIPDEVSASTVESLSIPYATGDYTLPVVPTDGATTITDVQIVSGGENWLTVTTATDGTTPSLTTDGLAQVTATNNTDGTSRSAVVSVKVENGTATATYLVTVYQGVAEDASITVPSEVLVYDYNYQEVLLDLDYTGTVTATPITGDADWYGVRNNGNLNSDGKLSYYLQKLTGTSSSTGYRQGMITVTAENNDRTAVGYIVIRQYEQDKAVVEGVSEINVSSEAATYSARVNLLNDSWIQNVRYSPDGNDSWLTVTNTAGGTSLTGIQDISFTVTANTSENSSREGYIYIRAINNNQEVCLYTITVTQDGAEPIADATISTVPDATYSYSATDETGAAVVNNVDVTVGAGVTTVVATHSSEWISLETATKSGVTSYEYTVVDDKATIAFTLTENDTNAERSAYITLTAKGDDVTPAVTYLKVIQSAVGDVPEVNFRDDLTLSSAEKLTRSFSLAGYITNGGVITKVKIDQGTEVNEDADWLYLRTDKGNPVYGSDGVTQETDSDGNLVYAGFDDEKVYYSNTENTKSTERVGQIIITVTNDAGSIMHTVEVTQYGVDPAATAVLGVSPEIILGSSAGTRKETFYTQGVSGDVSVRIISDVNKIIDSISETITPDDNGEIAVEITRNRNSSDSERQAVIEFSAYGEDGTLVVVNMIVTQLCSEDADAAELTASPITFVPSIGVNNATFTVISANVYGDITAEIVNDVDGILSFTSTTSADGSFTYDVAENSTNSERNAVVSFTAENSDGKSVTVYSLITQSAADAVATAVLDAPTELFVNANENTATTLVFPVSGVLGIDVEATVSSDALDLIGDSNTIENISTQDNYAKFSYVKNENTTDVDRSAVIRFSATNSDGVKTTVYTTITQYGVDAPVISVAPCLYVASDDTNGIVNYTFDGDGDVSLSIDYQSKTWITSAELIGSNKVRVYVDENTSTESRTGYVKLSGSGAADVYLEVVQYGTVVTTPTLENLPTSVVFYAGNASTEVIVTKFSLSRGTIISIETDNVTENSAGDWLTVTSSTTDGVVECTFTATTANNLAEGNQLYNDVIIFVIKGDDGIDYRVEIPVIAYTGTGTSVVNYSDGSSDVVGGDTNPAGIALNSIKSAGTAW